MIPRYTEELGTVVPDADGKYVTYEDYRSEVDVLEQLIDDFKDSPMLNDAGGDPSGITPTDVSNHIHDLQRKLGRAEGVLRAVLDHVENGRYQSARQDIKYALREIASTEPQETDDDGR